LGFNENDVQFANQLRFFRNGMIYYGTILDTEYAEKVIEFTKRIYLKLKKSLERVWAKKRTKWRNEKLINAEILIKKREKNGNNIIKRSIFKF